MMKGGSRGRSPSTEVKLRREVGAEAGDFGDLEGAVDGGGDLAVGAAGEVDGEESAAEFGGGGGVGEGGADAGQDDGLAEKRHGFVGASGDEEGVAFAGDVTADEGADFGRCRRWRRGRTDHGTRCGARGGRAWRGDVSRDC